MPYAYFQQDHLQAHVIEHKGQDSSQRPITYYVLTTTIGDATTEKTFDTSSEAMLAFAATIRAWH